MPVTPDDGPGEDAGRPDAGPDFGQGPGLNPFVTEHLPEDGSEDELTDTNILLLFSESMDPTVGTVTIQPGDVELDASDATWLRSSDLFMNPNPDLENIAAIFDPPGNFFGGLEFTVTVQNDFRDEAGEGLVGTQNGSTEEPFIFTFTTIDVDPPQVVECNPPEGGVNLSAAAITSISCTFNEQMNQSVGSLRIIPAQPLRDGVWTDAGRTITWELVRQLPYDTVYQAILEDFIDRSENLLDPSPVLGNGVLDFSTGPDADEPFIVVSVPTEGQRGVNPALTEIRVEFNENMDTQIGRNFATLTNTTADTSTDVEGFWNADGTILTYLVPTGVLVFMSDYELDFSAGEYRDVNGNLLDTATYLVDGVLNFRVDTDTFGPRVLSSSPEEGEVDVDVTSSTISVQFDEPMDSTISTAVLSDGTSRANVDGTWSAADTIIDFDIRAAGLQAGRNYTLELRTFQDISMNSLDASDVYLGDGVLNFRTADPNGDDCTQPLTDVQASATASGGLQWRIPESDVADNGSTDTCDSDSSGGASDVVIEYVKTSETLAAGGRALNILVDSNTTAELNFEVREGICDTDEENNGAIIACQESLELGGTTLDLPPGTYYIWIAKETGGAFPGATVTVEEIPAFPEGESCQNPFTTASTSAYVPPRMPGGAHTFQVRPGTITDIDRALIANTAGEISCASQHGADAVFEFTKAPGSVLSVRAIPVNLTSTSASLNLEISLGCDPTLSSYQSLACEADFGAPGFSTRRTTARATVSGPGGPVYFWLSSTRRDLPFPGAVVEITEINVDPGESCGTARTVTGPTAEIDAADLDSERALGGTGCTDPIDDISWFAYTATEDVVIVNGDASGPMILTDQETNLRIACQEDASQATPALVRAGRTVCIGLPNSTEVRELTFTEEEYEGVQGTVTDTGIGRPIDDSGAPLNWLSEPSWMASTDSTLYFGINGFGFGSDAGEEVMFAPIAGGVQAVIADGISDAQKGWAGLAIDDDIFTWDDTTSSTVQRVFLSSDGIAFPWRPDGWDDTPRNYSDFSETVQATYDGTNILYVNNDFTDAAIYELPTNMSATPVRVAYFLDIEDVTGFAADDTYVYFHANYFPSGGASINEGLWRVPRTSFGLSNAVPERLASYNTDCCQPSPLVLDDPTDPSVLYARQVVFGEPNTVHAVLNPQSATPLYIGPVLRLGSFLDHAMTYDDRLNALFLFERETVADGRIVRVD